MKSLKRGLKIDGQLMQIIFITRRSFLSALYAERRFMV